MTYLASAPTAMNVTHQPPVRAAITTRPCFIFTYLGDRTANGTIYQIDAAGYGGSPDTVAVVEIDLYRAVQCVNDLGCQPMNTKLMFWPWSWRCLRAAAKALLAQSCTSTSVTENFTGTTTNCSVVLLRRRLPDRGSTTAPGASPGMLPHCAADPYYGGLTHRGRRQQRHSARRAPSRRQRRRRAALHQRFEREERRHRLQLPLSLTSPSGPASHLHHRNLRRRLRRRQPRRRGRHELLPGRRQLCRERNPVTAPLRRHTAAALGVYLATGAAAWATPARAQHSVTRAMTA